MKHPDQAIDTALTGLGRANAAPGMERRILAAVERRGAAQSTSPWYSRRPLWLRSPAHPLALKTLAGSIALTATLAITIAALHRPSNAPAPATLNPVASSPKPVTLSQTEAPTPKTVILGEAERAASLSSRKPATRAPENKATNQTSLTHDSNSAYETLALSEMRAPSLPAPPLPLTNQEKLLLNIVHRNNPAELAALNPNIRAQEQQIAKAEFKEFFEPPTPADTQ